MFALITTPQPTLLWVMLQAARKAVAELKSRGVTRFLDLNKANKRNYDEVSSDDEAMDDDDGGELDNPNPRLRARLEPLAHYTTLSHLPLQFLMLKVWTWI